MLQFRDIDISDKVWIDELLRKSDFMGCEYSFANNMAWKRLYDSKITRYKDFYISCAFNTDDNIPSFTFPAGSGDYKDVISQLRAFSESIGKPLKLWGVTRNGVDILNEYFDNQFTCSLDRDSSDYIYSTEKLINLKGKKYHKKRNHLARFNEYEWKYSPITEKDFDDCILFCTHTYNEKNAVESHSGIAEQFAINTYFNLFSELELKGGIIRINNEIKALTIGEKLNSNTFCTHIEKADSSYQGVYVGICNEFAKSAAVGCEYINREEDLGIEGLRRSKLSYYPEFILEKYEVIFK
ncbi:MAG: DUF2156 domain-containing protein [Ruminococcus sp.]|nr:DUF2156 domain-containing protein [Ruminococcus sp.]